MDIRYLTSINRNSVSGDRVHIQNVVKEGKFNHKNIRLLKLYLEIFKNRNIINVVRESLDLLILGLLPTFILNRLLKNVIVEVNGSIIDEKNKFTNFYKHMQSKVLKSSKAVIFVSKGLELRFYELYKLKKTFVVNNGGPKQKQKKIKKVTTELNMAFIGANTSWQEVDRAVEKLNSMNNQIKKIVKICGPGFENFNNIKQKNLTVQFSGKISKEKVNLIYDWCDILIFPDTRFYHEEMLSSSIKVYELLSMNKLIWHIDDKEINEFNDQKIKFVKSSELNDVDLLNLKLEKCVQLRTWEDVSNDIKKIVSNFTEGIIS